MKTDIAKKIEQEKRVKIIYCKKLINKKEWEENYMHSPGYILLNGSTENGYWIAFSRVDNAPLPENIIPLDDDEMLQVDKYRKANNVFPECFETIDSLAVQKMSNCKNIKELKEVWASLNTSTKLVDFIKEKKNEIKRKFQSLGI